MYIKFVGKYNELEEFRLAITTLFPDSQSSLAHGVPTYRSELHIELTPAAVKHVNSIWVASEWFRKLSFFKI